EDAESFRTRAMRLTCSAGVSGLPQISIPAGTVNGCPAGISLIGWSGSDEVLLQLAGEIAKYCGIVL
ncbi:MAG TPA: hypothetical protein V6C72_08050, partial [Chroococcales cyanobacterium]